MAQASKPEEKKEVRPGLTDNYTPAANVLIQGFPELSISERYVVIGLVSLYWDEKVYPVSLRELAAKIQIDHTTLRSRGGKRPAEGILDKLWRLGFIGLMEGKPLTDIGNKGRVQTYLSVNHRFIADQNQMRTQDKKTKSPRYTTVGITNSETDKPTVGNDNDMVGDTNDTVVNTNVTVGNTNHTVVHVSTKTPPKNNKNITNNSLRTERENDGEVASTSNDGFANATPALTLSEEEIAFILQSRMEKSNEPQANFAYSQETPQTTLIEESLPESAVPSSGGYMQKTPVNEPPKPVKPASKQRKPKVEQPVLVDTSKKAVAYNDAEQRVFDWYCGCDFIHAKPEQDANKKKHCGKLAPHVHSQEDAQSLADFTKVWLKEHFKQEVYVVPLGNMAYSDTLNAWIAKQKQTKRASEPAAPQEIDLNKPVLWTRYQHTGPAIKHWFLYEDMPLVEAQQYGYKADVIVPNDRRNIRTSLKALAEGHQTLTPEEQNEKDHAELRLHLVA